MAVGALVGVGVGGAELVQNVTRATLASGELSPVSPNVPDGYKYMWPPAPPFT